METGQSKDFVHVCVCTSCCQGWIICRLIYRDRFFLECGWWDSLVMVSLEILSQSLHLVQHEVDVRLVHGLKSKAKLTV